MASHTISWCILDWTKLRYPVGHDSYLPRPWYGWWAARYLHWVLRRPFCLDLLGCDTDVIREGQRISWNDEESVFPWPSFGIYSTFGAISRSIVAMSTHTYYYTMHRVLQAYTLCIVLLLLCIAIYISIYCMHTPRVLCIILLYSSMVVLRRTVVAVVPARIARVCIARF